MSHLNLLHNADGLKSDFSSCCWILLQAVFMLTFTLCLLSQSLMAQPHNAISLHHCLFLSATEKSWPYAARFWSFRAFWVLCLDSVHIRTSECQTWGTFWWTMWLDVCAGDKSAVSLRSYSLAWSSGFYAFSNSQVTPPSLFIAFVHLSSCMYSTVLKSQVRWFVALGWTDLLHWAGMAAQHADASITLCNFLFPCTVVSGHAWHPAWW